MKKLPLHLLLLAALFLSACAGEVKGHVFLDKNNNNELDTDEKGIGKALYQVDRDDQLFTSGMTDENGMFFFKKKDKGDYCVKVINTSDKYTTTAPQLTKEPVAEKASAKAEVVGTGTTTETTATTSTTDEEAKKEETKKEPAIPPKPLPATASLKNCVRLTGYSDKAIVNVPVGLDVVASITRIPTQGEIVVAAGSEFDLRIYSPYRCTLNDLSLPPELSVVGDAANAVGSGNVLNLSTVTPEKTEAIIPKTLTEMAIVPVTVKLKANEDILEKERNIEITPTVECPDGNITPLETIKIKIKKVRGLMIKQDIPDINQVFGGSLTLVTTVENTGSFDYNGNAILTIELPAGAKIDSVDNTKCRTLLSQVQCDITSVNKGGDFKATLKMKLPSQANYDETNNEIKTKLNYNEEDDVNADGEETDVIKTEPIKVEINPSTGGLIVPWLLLPQGVGN